jgi:hypothetical protein
VTLIYHWIMSATAFHALHLPFILNLLVAWLLGYLLNPI